MVPARMTRTCRGTATRPAASGMNLAAGRNLACGAGVMRPEGGGFWREPAGLDELPLGPAKAQLVPGIRGLAGCGG